MEEKSLSFAKTGLGNKSALSIMDPCLECLFLNAHSEPTNNLDVESVVRVCAHRRASSCVSFMLLRTLLGAAAIPSQFAWMDWRAGS